MQAGRCQTGEGRWCVISGRDPATGAAQHGGAEIAPRCRLALFVASARVRGLLLCAKHLFAAATSKCSKNPPEPGASFARNFKGEGEDWLARTGCLRLV